jgi:hypothetical protein
VVAVVPALAAIAAGSVIRVGLLAVAPVVVLLLVLVLLALVIRG